MGIDTLHALNKLKLLRCRFVLRSAGIQWSTFKGFPLHGMLGRILHQRFPDTYRLLLGEGQAVGRPFVLTPPLDNEELYPRGREFTVEMIFFGSAAKGLLHCMVALEEIGRTGIDKARGKFELVRTDAVVGPQLSPVYTRETGMVQWPEMTGGDVPSSVFGENPVCGIRINFITPLRLKVDNRLHVHTPAFHLLLERIINRLNMLHGLDAKARLIAPEQERVLLEQAGKIELADDQVQWRDEGYQRYSARQKTAMTFGGLMGEAEYRGELTPFLPYLALGEYTHLGGQTTFGMGKYLLDITEQDSQNEG